MKKVHLFFLATLITSQGFAQNISTNESKESFNTGSLNAIVTTVFENDLKDVVGAWKKVLKDFKNESVKESKGELFGDNVLISEWGNNPVDVYTTFTANKKEKTVRMCNAIDLGGTFLSSSGDKEKFQYFEKLVKDFAIKQTKESLQKQVKDSEKRLSNLQGDQKDLEKKIEGYKNDIIEYKAKIAKNETGITVKETEIIKKKADVDVQKKVIETSSNAVAEQAKSSQKIYDKLTSQLANLEKEKRNYKEDIDKQNDRIRDAEKDIRKTEDKLAAKKTDVEKQKIATEELKKKLDGVS